MLPYLFINQCAFFPRDNSPGREHGGTNCGLHEVRPLYVERGNWRNWIVQVPPSNQRGVSFLLIIARYGSIQRWIEMKNPNEILIHLKKLKIKYSCLLAGFFIGLYYSIYKAHGFKQNVTQFQIFSQMSRFNVPFTKWYIIVKWI